MAKRTQRSSPGLPYRLTCWRFIKVAASAEAAVGEAAGSSGSSSRSSSPCSDHENVGSGQYGRCCGGRLCVVRLVQLAFLITMVAAVTHFILAAFTSALVAAPTPRPRPPVFSLPEDQLPQPTSSVLLDLHDFHYLHEAVAACTSLRLFFVFLVHSRPDHFRQREAIRATWGGLRDLGGGWVARTVFLLGRGSGDGDMGDPDRAKVEEMVDQESTQHRDLVVGSFTDHYHNLTYKHIMALRWAATHCAHATFLVKADDDTFIDVPALKALLVRTFDLPPPQRILACNVLPAGTKPQRTGKWAVSTADYPWPEYPRYCAGLAYVATLDLAEELARVAQASVAPRIWVDDVWVTGLLAESLHLHPHYLNLRYSYDYNEMVKWTARATPNAPAPYMFAHLDPACPDWRPTLDILWHHALIAHKNATSISFYSR
ncbi:beta-1,3-galactosyltransferase 1-like [Panulirus ornatus]|uniref:beta-1,3-galactosyltransferase 1-like n=1 Tax=Panulirus ornatus TaxID=150431 RepID=UPI003A840C55